jgi:hypothetical protein
MLMNCDCKTVTESPENILLHTKLETRALPTPFFTGVDNQHDQPNGAKFKIIRGMYLPVTQVYHFTHLCHFRPVSPIYLWILYDSQKKIAIISLKTLTNLSL